jgi:hypothetical protein
MQSSGALLASGHMLYMLLVGLPYRLNAPPGGPARGRPWYLPLWGGRRPYMII